VDHLARCARQRGDQAQPQAMTGGEVRMLSDLLARMQAFHAMALGSAAVCTGKLSVQQTRSPVPCRLSLAFEQSGGAVRLREIVEADAHTAARLPVPPYRAVTATASHSDCLLPRPRSQGRGSRDRSGGWR
jgi:hypothetical protein